MLIEDKARHLSWLPREAGSIHIVTHVIAGLSKALLEELIHPSQPRFISRMPRKRSGNPSCKLRLSQVG
jgi:hypothetical protein